MKFKKIGDRYVISLAPGEEIVKELTLFAEKEGISNASLLGIGAVDKAELAHYNVESQEYSSQSFEGAFEVANLTGNIFIFEGKPLVHAHITVGNDKFETFSGHLVDAKISAACEIVLTKLDSSLEKKQNKGIGLKMLDLT